MYVAISFKECYLFDSFNAAALFVKGQIDRHAWKIRACRKG